MIPTRNAFGVCREGKPVSSTVPDHALERGCARASPTDAFRCRDRRRVRRASEHVRATEQMCEWISPQIVAARRMRGWSSGLGAGPREPVEMRSVACKFSVGAAHRLLLGQHLRASLASPDMKTPNAIRGTTGFHDPLGERGPIVLPHLPAKNWKRPLDRGGVLVASSLRSYR